MDRRPLARLASLAAPALIGLAALGGCGDASVSPLPVEAASAAPSPVATSAAPATTSAVPSRTPAARRTTAKAPTPSTACMGPIEYEVDLSKYIGPRPSSICMTVGGKLRIKSVGPTGMTIAPEGIVDCQYEAAVRDCRLLEPGTVTFTVTEADEPFSFKLVVIR